MLRRRVPRLTPEQVLTSRPVRNETLKTEPIEGGGLRVHLSRSGKWWVWLLAAVFPIPKERVVELDAAGQQVWELCDGKNTFKEMVEAFQQRHKLTRAEAEWSLRMYLRDLGKRRMVAFLVRKPEDGKGEQSHGRSGGQDTR